MRLFKGLSLYALMGLLAAPFANATLIIDGNFTADFSTANDLSGSFSASFDDSVLTGAGFEYFEDLNVLTSLTLAPNPYLGTLFDTSNVFIDLQFNNGALSMVIIGGSPNASNTGDFLGDFGVLWLNGVFNSAQVQEIQGVHENTLTGSGVYTSRAAVPVPVPATLALFGLGLVGLVWSRRMKA